ncbi:MAG: TonB-dependent receptor [Burkholderiaceae bacterium]
MSTRTRGRTAIPFAPVRFAGSFAVSLGVVAFASGAIAQQDARQQLDPVVVTATRVPLKVSEVVADVTVIDREMLDRIEGRTLVEVLSQAPGVQFSSNGGLGKPSSLFVRGLEARHVLLLVDGVRVGSATLNTPSFDNLPLDLIDRIEIVRGPMTSLYGSNAMGGVIQIFTRRGGQGVFGNARVSGGSHGYSLESGGVGYAADGFDIATQVQHLQNTGISATKPTVPFGSYNSDTDGFRQKSGSLRAGWSFAPNWRVEGLLLSSVGKTQLDDGPDVDSRARIRNTVQSVQLDGTVLAGWRTRLAVGRSLDSYDTTASTSAFNLGAIETDQKQYSWENRVTLPLGEALVLLERIEQAVSRPVTPFAVSDRNTDAVALGYTVNLGASDLQASVRRDDYTQFGDKTTGAVAYAYKFTDAWRVGGSYGTSFTAPSFNQLYYPGFGNPDLLPETGKHGEIFVQWTGGPHHVRLTGYESSYDSYISSGPQPVNVPKVRIEGATLAWDARLDALSLSASYDYVDPINDTVGTSAYRKLLPRRARQAAKASADWQIGKYSVGASLQAYSHRFDDTANTVRLDGYGIVDLRADWAFAKDLSLGLRLNNVGGKDYETAYGYAQPGREGFVTLRWSMQ